MNSQSKKGISVLNNLTVSRVFLLSALSASLLTGCGGGGGGESPAPPPSLPPPVAPAPPAPPPAALAPIYTLDNLPPSTYATGSDVAAMFDSLNKVRIAGGFGALTQSAELDLAAKQHADYYIANYYVNGARLPVLNVVQPDGWLTGHTQTPGTAGFTGARPADRIAATGYRATIDKENIGVISGIKPGDEPSMQDCLSGLLNSVFHRAAMLSTGVTEIGFGISNSVTNSDGYKLRVCVLDSASKAAPKLLASDFSGIYPFNGQTAVPLLMAPELPDPVPGAIKGGPISIQVAGDKGLTVSRFELRDANAVAVATKLLTISDSIYLAKNEAYLVPIGSLKPNATYSVSFTGFSNGGTIVRDWKFTTAAK